MKKKSKKKSLTPDDIEECGCCGCYHPPNYFGDCRDDAYRFATPEAVIKYMGVIRYRKYLDRKNKRLREINIPLK